MTRRDGLAGMRTSPEGLATFESAEAPFGVACCQLDIAFGRREVNEQSARRAIRDAAAKGTQLVVLPELANSGYVFADAEEAHALGEPPDGTTVRAWRDEAMAHHIVVVGGFCERTVEGRVYNSAALVDADGVVTVYRKAHLWARETAVFSPGDAPAPIVDTHVGRVGVGVCYDLEFPEVARGLALEGAEIICFPMNWPRTAPPEGERSMAVTIAMATARLSHVFIAVCDRCGEERGGAFEGTSVIVDENGWLLDGPIAGGVAGTVFAECLLRRARDKRVNEWNDVLADRRPELYAASLRQPPSSEDHS
jgi:5-aminopentanamidase